MTLSPEHITENESIGELSDQLDELTIDELRTVLDGLDEVILAAVRERTKLSKEIGRQRIAEGGPKIVQSREMEIIERYSVLGQDGIDLAKALLTMGRGRLGR